MNLGFLIALALFASAAPPAEPPAPGLSHLPEGPVDFRCDSMQVLTKPNRVVCKDNVVLRRGDVLLCCRTFEGVADEHWSWQRFSCSRDVRALRRDELMWADKADFGVGTSNLVLTGSPKVRRTTSLITGSRITVDTRDERARVENPRGRIIPPDKQVAAPSAPAVDLEGPLPARCALPQAPKLLP